MKLINIFQKLFKPPKTLGFFAFNISFSLLIIVFSYHLEDTPLAYLSYLLSTYALIFFIIWFVQACKYSTNFIKKNSKLYRLYNLNRLKVTKLSLLSSLIFNFLYGLFKFTMGLYYKSLWFITFAVYYLALWEIRLSLVKNLQTKAPANNLIKKTGVILLLLNFVLMGIIILIYHQNKIIRYPGYLIYIIALYDFYLIIKAIINIFHYKNNLNPVIICSKCINLMVAMICIISLEVAMIYEFGNNDIKLRNIMIFISGFIVAIINSCISLYMITSKFRLKNNPKI